MNIAGMNKTREGMQSGMKLKKSMQTDSISKNIQGQIANAQKKLQDVFADKEMSLEDKMKKKQEIQQEIANLSQQLRQHQMEVRKEKQKKASNASAPCRKGSTETGSGLSQASMQAMISADGSMKQARVQGAMVTKLEGRAGVVEGEIRMDKGRGGSTKAKEAELADLKEKAEKATASQLTTLAEANETMEEAAKAEKSTETTEKKTDKTKDKNDKNKVDDVTDDKSETEGVASETTAKLIEQTSIVPNVLPETVSQPTSYVSVDIRL